MKADKTEVGAAGETQIGGRMALGDEASPLHGGNVGAGA